MSLSGAVIDVVILVCATLPYFAVFLAYNWTLNYRTNELETVVSTPSGSHHGEIPKDLIPRLKDELSMFYGWRNFAIGICMNVLVTVLLVFAALTKAHMLTWPSSLSSTIALFPKAALAAALGSYIANMVDLAEKARMRELSSYTYQWSWVKTIVSTAVGSLIGISVKDGFDTWVAFGVGILPVAVLLDTAAGRAAKVLGAQAAEKKESKLPDLDKLSGMTAEVISKLNEQGIICAQHLAFCNPIKLLARTNLEWIVILDFMDQALLYYKVGERMAEMPPLGIGGAIEMGTVLDKLASHNPDVVRQAKAVLKRLAAIMNLDEDSTLYLITTIYRDMHVRKLALLFGSVLGDSEELAFEAQA